MFIKCKKGEIKKKKDDSSKTAAHRSRSTSDPGVLACGFLKTSYLSFLSWKTTLFSLSRVHAERGSTRFSWSSNPRSAYETLGSERRQAN